MMKGGHGHGHGHGKDESDDEEGTNEVIIQPVLAEPLITAIGTGKWGITKLALKNLRDYYTKESKYDEETTLKLLRTVTLKDDLTIYEYACVGGHLEVAQQLCAEKINPDNEAKMAECNRKLTAKVQAYDDDNTAMSITQLLTTTMEMMLRRDKHTLAAQYYRVRHYFLFFLPGSILTAASAAMAFVSSAVNDPSMQKTLIIIVGVIATASTFIQTLNDQFGLGGKAIIHTTAAKALDSILLKLNFAAVDVIKNGASAFGAQQLEIVRKQATSVESSCSDPIPEFIHTMYSALLTEVEFNYVQQSNTDEKNLSDEIAMVQMQMKLATDITHEIVMSSGWPWCLSKAGVIARVKNKLRSQLSAASSDHDVENGKLNFENAVKLYMKKSVSTRIQPEVEKEQESPLPSRPKSYLAETESNRHNKAQE